MFRGMEKQIAWAKVQSCYSACLGKAKHFSIIRTQSSWKWNNQKSRLSRLCWVCISNCITVNIENSINHCINVNIEKLFSSNIGCHYGKYTRNIKHHPSSLGWWTIPVCPGPRSFLGCGTFRLKTWNFPGKLGYVSHCTYHRNNPQKLDHNIP